MSNKPREGDKYVIEIQSLYGTLQTNTLRGDRPETRTAKTTLFRIKGFPSVVFTEEDLKKLEKYEEPGIEVGDEVRREDALIVVITRLFHESGFYLYTAIDKNGKVFKGNVEKVKPTGRRFPSLVDALRDMRAGKYEGVERKESFGGMEERHGLF